MFVGMHVLLAHRTNTPELAITEDEGKSFMGAAQNVLRHYSVQSTQKTLDWIAFAGCAMAIYAPRVVAIQVRKREERRAENSAAAPLDMRGAFHPSVVQPGFDAAE